MSNSWEAQERRIAARAQVERTGEAGEFAERIGQNVADVGIDVSEVEVDVAVTAEEQMMDEMAERLRAVGIGAREAANGARVVREFWMRRDRDAAGLAVNQPGAEDKMAQKYRAIIYGIKNAKRAALQARVVLMALGWADEETESMRRCAGDYQLSVEQISNMVEAVQVANGLPKSKFNKSARDVATYKKTNNRQ
jgi:flavorubredoxin